MSEEIKIALLLTFIIWFILALLGVWSLLGSGGSVLGGLVL